MMHEVQDVVKNMTYIQFGEVANFVDMMNAATGIPHLDADRYPSVKEWKAERTYRNADTRTRSVV